MVRRGCPQGGVLLSLLWNMVINSFLGRLNNELKDLRMTFQLLLMEIGSHAKSMLLFRVQSYLSILIRHRWSFSPIEGHWCRKRKQNRKLT
jgi:hypothetical protein